LSKRKLLHITNFSVWVVFTNSVAKFRELPKSLEMTACVLRATNLTSSASIEEKHAWHCDLKYDVSLLPRVTVLRLTVYTRQLTDPS